MPSTELWRPCSGSLMSMVVNILLRSSMLVVACWTLSPEISVVDCGGWVALLLESVRHQTAKPLTGRVCVCVCVFSREHTRSLARITAARFCTCWECRRIDIEPPSFWLLGFVVFLTFMASFGSCSLFFSFFFV